jgi:hypothetical protein
MRIVNTPFLAGMTKRPQRRSGVKTEAEIEQQILETQKRIDLRLYESMWPSKVAIKVINCDDYDPLGD